MYSEVGPHGGYRVLKERILPPIAFTVEEAVAMFFSVHALRHYSSLPFEAESSSALSKFYLVCSSLLRAVQSLYSASVLSSLRGFRLDFSIGIGVVGSHVPNKRLCCVHAAFMPVTVWTVNRFPPDSSQVNDSPLVLMTSLHFRHVISH